MSEQEVSPLYNLMSAEIEGFSSLADLALDLRWSWNHGADGVWKQLDPALWELTSNPWVVLQTVSREKLRLLLNNPKFEVQVYLHDLDPNAVRVELCADAMNGGEPLRQEMTRVGQSAGPSNGYAYRAQVPAARPATDYTARVIPYHDGVAVPLEEARIQWQP